MTIQELINQAQTLTLPEQISLMRQLTQLIKANVQSSVPESNSETLTPNRDTDSLNSPLKHDFRELSGFLYRSEQSPISVEAMNAVIEEEAT